MSKILVKHVYAEEGDSKNQKAFKAKQKIDQERDEATVIHRFITGTNEQTFNRRDRNYE